MASGRRVNLYAGARSDLAESLGVPPGCLCRRATLILVAKTSGCIHSKMGHIFDHKPKVGALPLEYYDERIFDLYDSRGIQIGNDSSIILDGDIAFDLETRKPIAIDYFQDATTSFSIRVGRASHPFA